MWGASHTCVTIGPCCCFTGKAAHRAQLRSGSGLKLQPRGERLQKLGRRVNFLSLDAESRTKDPMNRSHISNRPALIRLLSTLLSICAVVLLSAGCGGSTTTSTGGAAATATSVAAGAASAAGSATAGMSASASGATSCPSANTTTFAKTKFVTHSGLAFGAFHRYLYKPFRAGTFQSGAHGRITAIVKAGVAALFIKREVRLAYQDVQANPTLCKAIAQPLQSVGDQIDAAVSGLKTGSTSGITALDGVVQSVTSKASSAGAPIKEDANAPLS